MAHPPLSAEQRRWFDAAAALIDEARLCDLILKLTAIHSPTGAERAASQFMADELGRVGLVAHYQPLDEDSGNAIGVLKGAGGGPSLLLYAPIDTHLEADEAEDVPWVGPALRPDMQPVSRIEDGLVIGLGAANPKAMVATMAEAARVIGAAKVPLQGDLIVAFAGGGMPVNAAKRRNHGLGSGVFHLLTRGVAADFAIVMKGGNGVYYEEPGLCWFKVTVKGTMNYAGMAQDAPGVRSSILPAARFIQAIEAWLLDYAARSKGGQVAPQGWVSAVRAGWPEKPAFPSAATEIYLDIRCHPQSSPARLKAAFADAVAAITARDGALDLDWEMIAAYPGARTDPDDWIIRSSIRAWEEVEGRPHAIPRLMGGQTDISTIRNLGIPTARTGWNYPPERAPEAYKTGIGGMGVVDVKDIVPTCKKIVYSAIDTLTRARAEVGL